jgi:hypothetical protein
MRLRDETLSTPCAVSETHDLLDNDQSISS